MKNFIVLVKISVVSLAWFLVLPFPFERFIGFTGPQTVWAWFGGYHLFIDTFQGILNIGDFAAQETNDSKYHYASHWYLLLSVLFSLVVGLITYKILTHKPRKLGREQRRSRK